MPTRSFLASINNETKPANNNAIISIAGSRLMPTFNGRHVVMTKARIPEWYIGYFSLRASYKDVRDFILSHANFLDLRLSCQLWKRFILSGDSISLFKGGLSFY